MNIKACIFSIVAMILSFSGASFADDTELYVAGGGVRSESKPQVLIIFDTSGSMGYGQSAPRFYPRNDPLTSSTKLFYDLASSDIPSTTSQKFILNSVNSCHTSKQFLNDYGFYTGFIREYRYTGQTGSWEELPVNDADTIKIIDCYEDIDNSDFVNESSIPDGTVPNGFPVDGEGSPDNPARFAVANESSSDDEIESAVDRSKLTQFGLGRPITIYTEAYINWENSTQPTESYSRMQVAKRVIEDIIVTTPGVDFGLAVFNYNHTSSGNNNGLNDGGRIISGIRKTDTDTKNNLLGIVESLDAEGGTPLCETLYEAYRYFSGLPVDYGLKNVSPIQTPSMDTSVASSGQYISPFTGSNCNDVSNIIFISDGEQSYDIDANDEVLALPGISSANIYQGSYMAALAGHLNKTDLRSDLDGEQTVNTYTIGFSTGANGAIPLLTETAKRGGGKFFSALNANALRNSMKLAVAEILQTNASFTAPAISTNNFDRTRTLDSVYYAMFLPNEGPRWSGNLKKFRVDSAGGILDQNSNVALEDDGTILSTACSLWTPSEKCNDGNDVTKGGAAEVLRSNTVASRKIISNLGGLLPLTKENASTRAGSDGQLAAHLNVVSTELDDVLNWLKGQDIDDDDKDNNVSEIRKDVLGDPLHSRPLAINYSSSADSLDIRIFMGTNHGFLHMFKDQATQVNGATTSSSISESWAFIPYDMLSNAAELRNNIPSGVHSVYGIDSPPVAYVERTSSVVTKAWVFFGLRRGGSAYYALNVTDPDNPIFLWKEDAESLGVPELGQTWSEPVITRVPGHTGPVLIVGAGYSPTTKDSPSIGTGDNKGRGVVIIDAETGDLVHFFGRGNVAGKTDIPELNDSIPNTVAVLDSDSDGITDRIYASDTGGNVWRIDMPSTEKNDWGAYKFADLGGDLLSNDRQFFAEPTVSRTHIKNTISHTEGEGEGASTSLIEKNIPYDSVVLGSGRRPNPKGADREDMFFALQDRNIVLKASSDPTPDVLTLSKLYNIAALGSPDSSTERESFSQKRGWYYDFNTVGEKTLAASVIINDTVFFPTYVPGSSAENQCLIAGRGRIYALDLHFGNASFYRTLIDDDGDSTTPEVEQFLPYREVTGIPDTPQIIAPGDKLHLIVGGKPEETSIRPVIQRLFYYIRD